MGLVTFLYVLIPFLRVKGRPLLRIDIHDGALYAFGSSAPFHELFPLLLALLAVLFGFLFVAAGFGRLWCGWACPQTILSELAEWFMVSTARGSQADRIARHGLLIAASVFFATVTCLYFVDASLFWPPLFLLEPGWGSGTWAVLALIFYGNMALMRRRFCTDLCPYGKILTVLTDESGLRVAMDPEAGVRCMRCDACVTACPMELDVREGPNTECIQCGLCIEACGGRFLEKGERGQKGVEGIVHFYMGSEEGRSSAVPGRALIPLAAAFLFAAAFLLSINLAPETRFQVRRSAQVPVRRTTEGGVVTFFTASVSNLSPEAGVYEIRVADGGGRPLELRGQWRGIEVAAAEQARVSFAVVSDLKRPPSDVIVFTLYDESGDPVSSSSITGGQSP